MKYLTGIISLVAVVVACQSEPETESVYTGRELSYPLVEGSYFEQSTSGNVVVKERIDQSIDVQIFLNGTFPETTHPVHLHTGTFVQDSIIIAYLNPTTDVGNGKSESVTNLSSLYDDTIMTFDRFASLNGSIKIHFEEAGTFEDVLLGATNIGRNYQENDLAWVGGLPLCTGELP